MSTENRKLYIGMVGVVLSVFVVYTLLYEPQWIQPVSYIHKSLQIGVNTNLLKTSSSLTTSTSQKPDIVIVQETPYHRVDHIPEKTEKLPFLNNFKNPCWREATSGNSSTIRCLPFFYLIGPPKCGTTDLHRRLTRHPKISSTVKKEIQWIAKIRYRSSNSNPNREKLSTYLKYFDKAVSTDIIPSGHDGYHDAILGDFSPSTIWYTKGYRSSPKFSSNAEIIHQLNPATKILVTLRNPVTRAYSDFKHFNPRASPQLFHSTVVRTIQEFNRRCKNTTYLKSCIDENRMFIGIYSVHLEDFLKVFPRDQIFITKLENRSNSMNTAIKEIFSFLEIESLPEYVTEKIVSQDITAKYTHGVPDMFNKTKLLLEDFFKPFSRRTDWAGI